VEELQRINSTGGNKKTKRNLFTIGKTFEERNIYALKVRALSAIIVTISGTHKGILVNSTSIFSDSQPF